MSRRIVLPLAVALLTVFTVGISAQQRAKRNRLQETQQRIATQCASAEAETQRLAVALQANERRETELKSKLAMLSSTATKAEPPSLRTIQERLDQEPALQVLRSKTQRNVIKLNYIAFCRKRGLTPEQTAAFEEALLRREEEQNDLFATLRAQGLSLQDPAVGKLMGKMMETYQKSQTELLGPEGLRELRDYERTKDLRQLINAIAGSATVAGTPFSPEQAEELVEIMVRNATKPGDKNLLNTDRIQWEAVDQEAQQLLSPEQFRAFQTLEGRGLYYGSSRGIARLNAAINAAAELDRKGAPSTKPAGG